MMNLVLFGIFVFLLVAIQFAGGQTIDEIIEKHIRAKGGLNKIDDIREMYMEGLISLMSFSISIKIAKYRDILNPSGFNMQWLITDEEGHTPVNSLKEAMPVDDLIAEMQEVPDMSEYLVNFSYKGYSAILVGKEMVGDNNCYHVKLTTNHQQEIHYWINTSGYMIQQSCFVKQSAVLDDTSKYITYFDYKPVDGIMIAHSLNVAKKAGNQNSLSEIVFNKIQINQPFESFIVKPSIQS